MSSFPVIATGCNALFKIAYHENRANVLAKVGAGEQFIGPEPPIGVFDKYLARKFKQWQTVEHQKE